MGFKIMFEKEIERYDRTVAEYKRQIVEPMGIRPYRKRNEVIFPATAAELKAIRSR